MQPPLTTAMTPCPQVLEALWEILLPCLKALEPCSEGSSIRLNLLSRLQRAEDILAKATPDIDNWKEILPALTQLTTTLQKDASVATWKDAWTLLSSDHASVIKSISPQSEKCILQAVASYCKQLMAAPGQDQQSTTSGTLSSPPTLTQPPMEQIDLTSMSFTPVPLTSVVGHAPAGDSMTTDLTAWLTNAATAKPVTDVAGKYSFIFKRTGEAWTKSILHGRAAPGTLIMASSLHTVGADGKLTCLMDLRMPVKTSGPELASLQQMEQKLRFTMAMNESSVEKQDSESRKRTGSSAWEQPFPKRYSSGSRTTYRH